MKKKKFLIPAVAAAMFVGAGVGTAAYMNNTANNEPVVMAQAQGEETHEEVSFHSARPLMAVNEGSSEQGNTSSESEKVPTKDEIAAKATDDLIAAIGEVTEDSREAIKAAKASYESLTYEQQKLVTKTKTLEEAIKAYNKLIIDDEDIKPIEALEHKTALTAPFERYKGLKTTLIVLGTITGLIVIYFLYLGIKKLFKLFK